jgi:hypothetical protein
MAPITGGAIMEMERIDAMEVQCERCLKTLAQSGVQHAELGKRVVHFCGPQCYEEWFENLQMMELSLVGE